MEELPKWVWMTTAPMPPGVEKPALVFERRAYLWPSRYFHLYLFFERQSHATCWLPAGCTQ